jgi:Mrp family chromosome partitioning ATPase
MSRDKTARLRMDYTGEPYSTAYHWYRRRGLFNGLVPDTQSPQQQMLEAMVLRTLARPHREGLPSVIEAGTVFGLEGVSPDVDSLILRPAGDLVAQVLARLLPCAARTTVVGVPGLRPQVSRHAGLTLARVGEQAQLEVQSSVSKSVQAAREDLQQARELAVAAGLTPLWDGGGLQGGEGEAWHRLRRETFDAAVWSTALRRIGLFMDSQPDWQSREPDPVELEGPKPARILPRPVGGIEERPHGVVAVTSGSGQGGNGCTTTVLALAGALVRSGAKVGILTADDPNGILAHSPSGSDTADDGWHCLTRLDGGRTLHAAVLPTTVSSAVVSAGWAIAGQDAGPVLDQARARFDVVVIDAGGSFQHRALTERADVAVALVQHDDDYWAESRLVDRRPDRIQFFAWLNKEFAAFRNGIGRPLKPLEELLSFLDVEFGYWVRYRTDDGDLAVYDPDDREDVEAWWAEHDAISSSLLEDPYDAYQLPEEQERADLDQWRAEFIAQLADEGARRHGQTWAQAARQWAQRNKDRNLRGLRPGELEPADVAGEFTAFVEDRALARWGRQMWDQYSVWAVAREAGDDLAKEWAHLLETERIPRKPHDIADQLRAQLRGLPDVPTLLALARAEPGLGHDRVAAVREEVIDGGFLGLVVVPRLRALTELARRPERAADLPGEAAGASNRLAHVVSLALHETSTDSRPR